MTSPRTRAQIPPSLLANAVLIGDAIYDDVPTTLVVPASRIVGRKATGGIAALTAAEAVATATFVGGTITSPVTVASNANVATDLARFTGGLAQNVPQIGDLYLFRAWGDLLANSGAPTYVWGLRVGTTNPFTTDLTAGAALSASASRRTWYVEARIGIISATSQQVSADFKAQLTTTAAWVVNSNISSLAVGASGSSAENTGTGARDVALTVRMDVNNASVDAVCRYASLQRIAA